MIKVINHTNHSSFGTLLDRKLADLVDQLRAWSLVKALAWVEFVRGGWRRLDRKSIPRISLACSWSSHLAFHTTFCNKSTNPESVETMIEEACCIPQLNSRRRWTRPRCMTPLEVSMKVKLSGSDMRDHAGAEWSWTTWLFVSGCGRIELMADTKLFYIISIQEVTSVRLSEHIHMCL